MILFSNTEQDWPEAVRNVYFARVLGFDGQRPYKDVYPWFDEEIEFIRRRFGHKLTGDECKKILTQMISDGLLTHEGGILKITELGREKAREYITVLS